MLVWEVNKGHSSHPRESCYCLLRHTLTFCDKCWDGITLVYVIGMVLNLV